MAANLSLANAFLVDGQNSAIESPIIGEQLAIRVEYATEDLPANASYRLAFSVDGVTLDQISTHGAGGSGIATWNVLQDGWFATGGQHTATVTIDVDGDVAESSELDNSLSFQFTPISASPPTTFQWPFEGQQLVDSLIARYVDLDPLGGVADYRGGPITYNGHRGWDITPGDFQTMDKGVRVYAAADGVVVDAADGEFDRQTAWLTPAPPANQVVLDHGDGWQSTYKHLRRDSVRVQPGDVVRAGQFIGYAGSSGFSDGTHLHLEVSHHSRTVELNLDPGTYLDEPVAYTADQVKLFASGITNYSPLAHLQEHPSEVNVFKQEPGQIVYATAALVGVDENAQIEFLLRRPDGSVYLSQIPSLVVDPVATLGLQEFTLPADLALGTWQIDYVVNGTKLGDDQFEVTIDGAPEIRIEDGEGAIILDGRYTPLQFGPTNLNDVGPTRSLNIINHGDDDLHLQSMVVPRGFLILVGPPTILGPGESASITIQIDTTLAGYKAGEVEILSNDADESAYTFSIEGYVADAALSPLVLGISDRMAAEGDRVFGNVRRFGDLAQPLQVSLIPSDASAVVVAKTITFLPGENWKTFTIDVVSDAEPEGTDVLSITATALGHTDAANQFKIKERNSADFNGDGKVDGFDFLLWQRGDGIPAPLAAKSDGDADNDRDVDGYDLDIWENEFGFNVAEPISADFDGDGQFDGFDFLLWQRGYGTLAPFAVKVDGDADNDSDVDGDDLDIWKSQFGDDLGSPALSSAAVDRPDASATASFESTANQILVTPTMHLTGGLRGVPESRAPANDNAPAQRPGGSSASGRLEVYDWIFTAHGDEGDANSPIDVLGDGDNEEEFVRQLLRALSAEASFELGVDISNLDAWREQQDSIG